MIPYMPRKFKSEYEAALNGDANQKADFEKVWAFYTAIPIDSYVSTYNKLEGKGNIEDLSILESTVQAAIKSVAAEILSYQDLAVQAPLNDLIVRLRLVESETSKEIKAYSTSSGDGLLKVISSKVRKAQDAYGKFANPGKSLFNATEKFVYSGGSWNPFKKKK